MAGHRSRGGSMPRGNRSSASSRRVTGSLSTGFMRITSGAFRRSPSNWRARCNWDLQVPTAIPSIAAVSSCE